MSILYECIECGIMYGINVGIALTVDIFMKKIKNLHIIGCVFWTLVCALTYIVGIGYTDYGRYIIIEVVILIGMYAAKYCDIIEERIVFEMALFNLLAALFTMCGTLDIEWVIIIWLMAELYILIMCMMNIILKSVKFNDAEKNCIELFICTVIAVIGINMAIKRIDINAGNSLLKFTVILCAVYELVAYNMHIVVMQMEEKYNKIQYANEYYEVERIQNMYNESRKLKHDLRQFITMALGYMEEKRYDEAKIFLGETMKNRIEEYSYYKYCDNRLVNYILNDKNERCRLQDIEFKCMVIGNMKYINEIDMSILLGNVIDNAIEAAQKADDKYVNVEIEMRGSIIINVENSIRDTFLGRKEPFLTTKADSLNHGIGTKSIQDIVSKYYGEITYTEQNRSVNCQIILLTDRIPE